MDIEANKALVKRFSEALNSANWDNLDDLLTEDFRRQCQATPDVTVEWDNLAFLSQLGLYPPPAE
jgi:hypothetical protein